MGLALAMRDADGSEVEIVLDDAAIFSVPPPAEFYGYSPFVLYPAALRVPLTLFAGVDQTRVTAIMLRSAGSSGALLLADFDLFDHDPSSGA